MVQQPELGGHHTGDIKVAMILMRGEFILGTLKRFMSKP
jgi:hypothetical protein